MTFTYNGDPSASSLEWVRFQIQDVTSASALFTDEEINGVLSEQANKHLAAAQLCDVLASRYSSQVDFTNAALSERKGQLAAQWSARAVALRGLLQDEARAAGAPQFLMGGQTIQERIDQANSTTSTQPDFGQGMLDNPRAGGAASLASILGGR